MWSYRLYRYPSPSSSSLVYGTGKADESMLPDSPDLIANAVYRALESGTKLPPLNDTEEVRQALLAFKSPKHSPTTGPSDLDNGNYTPPRPHENGQGHGHGQLRGPWWNGGMSDSAGKGKQKEKTAGDKDRPRKSAPASPVLMLEALSRRRMDAVRQLYEVCPAMLAAIPLFDPPCHRSSSPSPQPEPPLVSPCAHCHAQHVRCSGLLHSHQDTHSEMSSGGTTIVFKSNYFPLRRSSRLLDLAAENRALLVFVLQHHPDVDQRQHRAAAASSDDEGQADAAGKSEVQSDAARVEAVQVEECSADATVVKDELRDEGAVDAPELGASRRDVEAGEEEAGRPPEDSQEKEGAKTERSSEGSAPSDLDPTSPITICINKNNPEVLQYLLFKHVWQHFLLDEIFKLPQNSLVPDMEDRESLFSTCPECGWFLPCAALLGCPYLLDLLLCGKFCKHPQLLFLHTSHNSTMKDVQTALEHIGAESVEKDAKWTDSVAERDDDDAVSENLDQGQSDKSPSQQPDPDLAVDTHGAHVVASSVFSPTGEFCDPGTSHDSRTTQSQDIGGKSATEEAERSNSVCTDPKAKAGTRAPSASADPEVFSPSPDSADIEDSPAPTGCTSLDPITLTVPSDRLQHGDSPALSSAPALASTSTCSRPCSPAPKASLATPGRCPEPETGAVRSGGSSPNPLASGSEDSKPTPQPSVSGRVVASPCTPASSGSPFPDPGAQPLSLFAPDPNALVAVSLPVMDRWISRCMHVRLSPLHFTCWRCDPGSIRVLLRHGADVRAMAKELETQEVEKGEGNVLDSSGSRMASTPSSESSLELTLNFVSVTWNSSSVDLSASYSSLENRLKRRSVQEESAGLSPLALLALGIRSPPDFSLSIGKSLGLVLPSLPELWGGQVDRSCPQAKASLMEALGMLLEAGSDVNQPSTVFGKSFRVLELFLQPSVDLYYAPLMPRGGRDSAVLRCMDLERVSELVLSACWELCARGARLGPSFSASLEWNLFHMDWMFLQNETLQRRFLHLAIFLGLFPPLDPELLCGGLGTSAAFSCTVQRHAFSNSGADPGPSSGGVDLTEPHLPPYSPPPRPSCVPWAPSTSRTSTPRRSDSSLSGGAWEGQALGSNEQQQQQQFQLQPSEVVTSYYSTAATQVSLTDTSVGVAELSDGAATVSAAPPADGGSLDASLTVLIGSADSSEYVSQHRSVSGSPTAGEQRESTAEKRPRSALAGTGARAGPTTEKDAATASRCTSGIPGPSTVRAQMVVWALEERQRRCLEKLVNDVLRLAMPQASLGLILRFLCLPDLRLLASVTQHLLHTSTATTLATLQRLHDAVRQAQSRSLRHSCKLVILIAARWRYSAMQSLPLPDSLKRYLVDTQC